MTGLVILMTGVWNERVPTELDLSSGDITFVSANERNIFIDGDAPAEIPVVDGAPMQPEGENQLAWHDAEIEHFFVDADQSILFTGTIFPALESAVGADGTTYTSLYGDAMETGAPLTTLAFVKGLSGVGLGGLGRFIVTISVLLFAISTAISWSYYGDRCANYLFGTRGIYPYKVVFVLMHFVGATVPLATIWILGDVALGLVTFPNLVALVLLSGVVSKLTKSYFERKPWLATAEARRQARENGE